MKKRLILLILMIPILAFGQKGTSKIKIEAKPADPKKGYIFELIKSQNEVKIYYKSVDSIAKFSFAKEDEATMKRLLGKAEIYFDSLTKDSLAYFQHKVDSIKIANTYYSTDSASIYKSSHPAYWKSLETILLTPNSALETKKVEVESVDHTYCFFTFTQNNEERQVFIEALDTKIYPVLTKLVDDTMDIIKAHKQVMRRRNQ